jgi:hypothetical protein
MDVSWAVWAEFSIRLGERQAYGSTLSQTDWKFGPRHRHRTLTQSTFLHRRAPVLCGFATLREPLSMPPCQLRR